MIKNQVIIKMLFIILLMPFTVIADECHRQLVVNGWVIKCDHYSFFIYDKNHKWILK